MRNSYCPDPLRLCGRLTLAIGLSLSIAAQAQPDKPRLMLNTGGPVGGIRALSFSSDASQLYAAGAGKVVNVWEIRPDGPAPRAIPADPLRWEVARGMRGRIYALDVATGTGEVVIGGYSARESTGDLAVFDPRRQRLVQILPTSRPDTPEPGPQPGHAQTVVSVCFSPSGRGIVSMSIDGEVRLWRNHARESIILNPAGDVTDGRVQAAAFVDENRVVFPRRDRAHPRAWRLVVVDTNVNGRASLVEQPIFWDGVAALSVGADGRQLAASDHLGEVTLFGTDAPLVPRPLNRPRPQVDGRFFQSVASLSCGTGGLLAITTQADAAGACWLELWDTLVDPPRLMTQRPLGRGDAAFASAFSPDGTMLAVTLADRSAVELIPLRNDPAAALDEQRVIELTGRGRPPSSAAFVGNDGYRLALSSEEHAPPLLFDLQLLQTIEGDIPAETRPEPASGWRIVPQPTAPGGSQELQILAPGARAPQCSVVLQTPRQGTYLRHAWLTDAQGQAYGIAVGTARMDGIFLYDLPRSGRCRLWRYLRDHSDTILGLSVSADGRYLASSSLDQTVKIWSLAGLRGVGRSFPREDAWGATFAVENGRVVVTTALAAGIAAGRDLLPGDVITRAIHADAGGIVATNEPQAILQALADLPLWETLRLSTQRNGAARAEEILITPAWEPLATLFIDRSGEWAMWTPQGVYDSSAGGDELFGWHVNVGRTQDPQFFRAEKFRRELEQPDVMRQLLTAGSLAEARQLAGAAQARPVEDIAAALPQLRLDSPLMGTRIAPGETVAVQASVRYPDGTDAADFRARLFVNQIDGGAPQVRQAGNEFLYSWAVPPAGEQNQILVRVEEASGAVDAPFQDSVVQVTAEAPAGRMRMHVFAVAAENYAGLLHQPYCNDDAQGLAELLKTHNGRQYEVGHVEVVTDEQSAEAVSKAAVEQKIAQFREKLRDVKSEDLLVVFVAGHGRAYGQDYFFIPPDDALGAAPGEAVIRRIGIPWDMLRSLAEVPCRKVYLLDTCYSGNVAQAEKSSLRPLKQMQAMIFAATSENQEALGQHPSRENGLFTGFLLDGCSGKADGVDAYEPVHPRFAPRRDGQVDLQEVVSYVSFNVRGFNRFQRPKYTPIQLLNFVDLPLFTVPIGDLQSQAPPRPHRGASAAEKPDES